MLVNKVWRKRGVSLQNRYICLLLLHMMCVVIRPDVVDWSHELDIFTVPPIFEVLHVSSVNSHRVENSYEPSLLYRMTCSRLKPLMAKDMFALWELNHRASTKTCSAPVKVYHSPVASGSVGQKVPTT